MERSHSHELPLRDCPGPEPCGEALESEPDDVQQRRLAAVIVKPVGRGRLLSLAVRGLLGQLGEAESVRNFSFRTMTVQPWSGSTRRPMKVAVDGEIFWARPPLRFRVAPEQLMLMVPRAGP